MTEKVANQLEQIYNKGRKAKKLIPQGLILDLGWNTDQQGTNRQTLPKEKQPEVTVTQTTPIQVEGPPSSRLRSKTNKNNVTVQQDHQDPPECNRTPVDPPNAIQEVNKVQTAATAGNRMQIVLPLMLIAILLLINVFFISDYNDAKSTPFAHMHTVKNPSTPPSNQKAHNSCK